MDGLTAFPLAWPSGRPRSRGRDGAMLIPAGSVGSELTAATSRDLRRRLGAGETISDGVEYRGRTPSGGPRHAALAGIPEP